MKAKKFTPAMRGLAALMTCLMVLSIVGTGVANTYRGALDDTLGTESYVTINDDSAARFKTDYAYTVVGTSLPVQRLGRISVCMLMMVFRPQQL